MSVQTLKFDQVSLVGVRGKIDEAEQKVIQQKKIRQFTSVTKLKNFMDKKQAPVHISFDVSALDPKVLDSTGDLEPNGMKTEQIKDIIQHAAFNQMLVSLDVVEFNAKIGNDIQSLEAIKQIFGDGLDAIDMDDGLYDY